MFKALTLTLFGSGIKTKATSARKESVNNWRFYLSLALVVVSILLLVSYIYGVNAFASAGYEIKTMQKKLGLLNEENKKIKLKVSEASSMVMIQTDFLNANFVPAGTPKFVEVGISQFTQR